MKLPELLLKIIDIGPTANVDIVIDFTPEIGHGLHVLTLNVLFNGMLFYNKNSSTQCH